ncbi:MAG: radical SAM protein [Candidatus Altiarchaeales archaeon ex4484_96]|nr:MAG: radical SAM protein [Candidatus Altiarchaeales archaeon ex4484_96]
MRYLFGPVPSRRLGSSLGVDLVPYKTCSFDCVYCQLGKTTKKTTKRIEYVPFKEVLSEIEDYINAGGSCDYITLSGSGEPTLNSCLGEIIDAIKSLTDIPVAVLTNSSLLGDDVIRRELAGADLLVPSLDAATQGVFEQVNRPCPGIDIEDIIGGLVEMRKILDGLMWLEVLLVAGVNDKPGEVDALKDAIEAIKPDRIQLNTVIRPPAESYAKPVSEERMGKIAAVLGAELVQASNIEFTYSYKRDVEESILDLLGRRPCTLGDLSVCLGLHVNEVVKYLQELMKNKKIESISSGGGRYYRRA